MRECLAHGLKLRDLVVNRCQVFFGDRLDLSEPPQLNWSTAMFRKRRTENGKQATQARRDCLEVTTG